MICNVMQARKGALHRLFKQRAIWAAIPLHLYATLRHHSTHEWQAGSKVYPWCLSGYCWFKCIRKDQVGVCLLKSSCQVMLVVVRWRHGKDMATRKIQRSSSDCLVQAEFQVFYSYWEKATNKLELGFNCDFGLGLSCKWEVFSPSLLNWSVL